MSEEEEEEEEEEETESEDDDKEESERVGIKVCDRIGRSKPSVTA